MGKILIIRGGALGDFLLTLPAISLLRDALPEAEIEVLGYGHFVRIAERAGLVDSSRSIEYSKLAPFFAERTVLEPELMEYFASFDVVVSYLFDPDRHFAVNLERSKVETLLVGPHRPVEPGPHAAVQLAEPLESLAVFSQPEPVVRLEIPPSSNVATKTIAIQPGSGSPAKNWSSERFIELGRSIQQAVPECQLLLITGEVEAVTGLRDAVAGGWGDAGLLWSLLDQQPLDDVAEALAACVGFVGNDSGVSHLAGALGIPTLALFGPTNPDIWCPVGERAEVLRAPNGDLMELSVGQVIERMETWF